MRARAVRLWWDLFQKCVADSHETARTLRVLQIEPSSNYVLDLEPVILEMGETSRKIFETARWVTLEGPTKIDGKYEFSLQLLGHNYIGP